MMTDGVKNFEKEESIKVLDVAELIAKEQEKQKKARINDKFPKCSV